MKKNRIIGAALAVLVAGGLSLAASTTASAHSAVASLDCGGWYVEAAAYDEGAIGTVVADGVTVFGPGTFGGAGYVADDWAAEAETHTLSVTIDSADDRYDYSFDESVTFCLEEEPEPTPVVVPGIQDYVGACDAAFVLDNLGSTLPVVYTVNGVRYLVEAGTAVHTDADGTRIAPIEGLYTITTDTGRAWTFPALECPVEEPPTEEPPVVTEPPVVEPPVEEPVVEVPVEETPVDVVETIPAVYEEAPVVEAPAPVVAAPAPTHVAVADAPETLPQTGSSLAPLGLALGALALIGGAIALIIRRALGTEA